MENSKDHKAAAEPPLDCRVMPQTWCFSWTNWKGTELTRLTLHDRTKEDAFEVAKGMGWTPIRWWQWWRWFNDDDYHRAA